MNPTPKSHAPIHTISQQFKIAAYVLGPLSLPVGFVAAIVYDPEFRDDVDRHFPEIGACVLTHGD